MHRIRYRRRALTSLTLLLLFITSSIPFNPVEAKPENAFKPNELIVGVKEITDQALTEIIANGGTVLELLTPIKAIRVHIGASVENAFVTAIKGKAWVSYVERNAIVKAVYVPSDAYWGSLWGMRNIKADQAWDIHKGLSTVVVAVVDTGVEYTHPDLAAHYMAGGYDWVNTDKDPLDDNGHGTHCAGVAAAVMDNGIGVVGVAQVSVMAEKVLDSTGSGTMADVANGITHAADNGAKVISLSLGAYFPSITLQNACQYAWNRGCILVAAAGNDFTYMPFYPAAYDTVIAVAATNIRDSSASYSNFGDWIELSAPGGDGSYTNEWILSTYKGGGYAWGKGTSMAAPHVSGLAALVWSYKPSLINQELRTHLYNTADDLGYAGKDIYFGYGRINAYRALNELGPIDKPPTCTIIDPVNGQTLSGIHRVLVSATDDHEVAKVELRIDGGTWIDITANYLESHYYYDWYTTSVSEGSHTLIARAIDAAGQTTNSPQITVTVDNQPDKTMYVKSIDFNQNRRVWLDIMVTIHDATEAHVLGATVQMNITYPNGKVKQVSAVTNNAGVATYRINRPVKGTYTVTVVNVEHVTFIYQPSANRETIDSYIVK